jgi:hypothetical protein
MPLTAEMDPNPESGLCGGVRGLSTSLLQDACSIPQLIGHMSSTTFAH